MDKGSLKEFFEPSSVAVIGASGNPEKVGHMILKNIVDAGYAGQVFPVNPNISEILGIRTYPSIEKIPVSVDLAVIVVPSTVVPKVMEECARKNVRAAIVISGGFRETGEHGLQLEKTVLETARKASMRIIGPNCPGVNNPHFGLCATFGGFSRRPGFIAIITQSGSVGAAIQCWADREGIGISKCVGLGNKVDVNETHLLQFLKDDDNTKVIALYLEGVTNGRAFMNTAAEVSKTKPIVVLKGGMTRAGARAVFSHTSALAGRSEIFEAALKQAGVIKANSLEELYDIAKAFAFLPLPKGSGVLIVESTGGAGVLAADMCEKFGLKLPEPDEHAKEKLRKILSGYCTFSNPFDLTTDAFTPSRFRSVIEENMENTQFHGFIIILDGPIPGAAEEIKKASTETAKPILVSYLGGGETELVETSKMHSIGIPVFPTPERAVTTFYALMKYSEYLRKRVQ